MQSMLKKTQEKYQGVEEVDKLFLKSSVLLIWRCWFVAVFPQHIRF